MTHSTSIEYVNVDWLKSNLSTYPILDFQPDVHDYIKEHIPAAVYINEQHFRCFIDNQPAALVPPQIIETILAQAGLNNSTPVVVYSGQGRFSHQGDGLEQTMAAYTLARFGHNQIYILNGGIDSWIEAGCELDQKFPVVKKSNYTATIQTDFFVNYQKFMELRNDPQSVVIDIRPNSIYQGKSIWRKPGHIPGAINLPWRNFTSQSNALLLRPEQQIKDMINEKNINPSQTIILYCGTGREATCAFIVFKFVMNFPNVKIFEGSFTEWCTYENNESVTGPNPF